MDQELTVVDPFNRTEERALINLVTPLLERSIFEAHKARPELFGIDERGFDDILGPKGVSPTCNALRMRFWLEYDEAQLEHRKMKEYNIWSGVCNQEYFRQKFLLDPVNVAWMLTRPASYEKSIAEMHQFALKQMRKILEKDLGSGKIDTKLGELQFKIFQALDVREKGAVVQKTLNVHATPKQAAGLENDKTKQENLEKRLEQLERESGQKQAKIIDARTVDAQ